MRSATVDRDSSGVRLEILPVMLLRVWTLHRMMRESIPLEVRHLFTRTRFAIFGLPFLTRNKYIDFFAFQSRISMIQISIHCPIYLLGLRSES
jgi:hypothetical protein